MKQLEKSTKQMIAGVLSTAVLVACSSPIQEPGLDSEPEGMDATQTSTEEPPPEEPAMPPAAPTARQRIQLTQHNLPMLRNGFQYEGWAIINAAPVSFGKFNVDASGAAVDLDGIAIEDNLFDAGRDLVVSGALVITIEPPNDPDIAPADTKFMAADVVSPDSPQILGISHSAVIGTDFKDAMGNYILATPTDEDSSNEHSGIWFLDKSIEVSSGPPAPGLVLPTLATGWVYEGWAVIDGQPVSTGRFTDPAAMDESALFSGASSGPPRPGEDFLMDPPSGLTFPVDLSGMTAVISVEPQPDDSPAPFALKPLIGQIPANAAAHQTLRMDNNAQDLPTATFQILP